MTDERMSIREAAENVLIAWGMGWDLDGVMEQLRDALNTDRLVKTVIVCEQDCTPIQNSASGLGPQQ